jgi:hypothetical protein
MAIKIAGTEVINDNRELVLAKLTEINKSIADTAVDIFVYDTAKDSDGGAWRKRTQHTSWYNETLNTATRGSRKEFPAVAVIVAESNQVTIYDGDDPDLPMWMVFNAGGGSFSDHTYIADSSSVDSLGFINAQMVVGNSSGYGIFIIDFLKETSECLRGSDEAGLRGIHTNVGIANRNTNSGEHQGTLKQLASNSINDVAMTVLPNAPIDAATGLPVPTIAVATNGGISVIRDDGTVVDITESSGPDSTHAIEFTNDNKIVFMWSDTNGIDRYPHIGVMPIPSSDESSSYYYSSTFIEEDYSYSSAFTNANEGPVAVPNANHLRDFSALSPNKSVGYDSGLSHIYSNPTDARRSMVAYTTSDYNTGWMNGDIKLATLSDTDDTDVTGSELVTNGTFDSDTAWAKVLDGWTISGGTANHSGAQGYLEQTGVFEVGKTYVLTFTNTGTVILPSGTGISSSNATYGSSGTYHVTGVAVSTKLSFYSNSTTTLDNISVRLAEEDRSVNGNGLQVFGTVYKNPVATGADLVGYSGLNGSNYLKQPVNALGIDWSTEWAIMFWTLDQGFCVSLEDENTSSYNNTVFLLFNDATNFVTRSHNANYNVLLSSGISGIHHIAASYKDGRITIYQDGVSIYDNTSNGISNLDVGLQVGSRTYNGAGQFGPVNQTISLFRASATAPSPEQIKKIYEDEKVLFQENAQATLYGSSDAVTALAYDDTTELLHVGTSAGRSVFQGLRRVDNTTDAVGAAISASNGLVAED